MSLVILLTGRNASGKGASAEYLREKWDFSHKEVRPFIREVAVKAGISLDNRPAMTKFANEQRRQHGAGFFVVELYHSLAPEENAVIESIRNPGEITDMQEVLGRNVVVFAFDAKQKIRYERLKARDDEFAKISFEEFLKQEYAEESSSDPNRQNISGCMRLAHFHFNNDGDLWNLRMQISDAMSTLWNRGLF